jgi:hypothetical protein
MRGEHRDQAPTGAALSDDELSLGRDQYVWGERRAIFTQDDVERILAARDAAAAGQDRAELAQRFARQPETTAAAESEIMEAVVLSERIDVLRDLLLQAEYRADAATAAAGQVADTVRAAVTSMAGEMSAGAYLVIHAALDAATRDENGHAWPCPWLHPNQLTYASVACICVDDPGVEESA